MNQCVSSSIAGHSLTNVIVVGSIYYGTGHSWCVSIKRSSRCSDMVGKSRIKPHYKTPHKGLPLVLIGRWRLLLIGLGLGLERVEGKKPTLSSRMPFSLEEKRGWRLR